MILNAIDISQKYYDAVIVGSGIAGAIIAKELSEKGNSVLILEAGSGEHFKYTDYQNKVDSFHKAFVKSPNSPYPANVHTPQPNETDVISNSPSSNSNGYFVQKGPHPFKSDYTRTLGGTTLHWLGTSLRMIPEDFKTRTNFSIGLDWPITYDELHPYYQKAEEEIGVSGDAEEQRDLAKLLGINEPWYYENYVYPMHKIPPSYLDKYISNKLSNFNVTFDGVNYPVKVTSTPQARNGIPNENYNNGKYLPVPAVGNKYQGHRCMGYSSCVPICPIQAKYSALKTLKKALDSGNVTIVCQSVVTDLELDADGKIKKVNYKAYPNKLTDDYINCSAYGKIFILAANSIENSKILLASGIKNKLVGKYLMDHPFLLTWGLSTEHLGTLKGPGSTSGIESLRSGDFRKYRSAYRIEIANLGWIWPKGTPYSLIEDLVINKNLNGEILKQKTFDLSQRQVQLGFMLEQPAFINNSVSIDSRYKDKSGNFRPIINYKITDYVLEGLKSAKNTALKIYKELKIEEYTKYNETDAGFVEYEGTGYTYSGAGHVIGGHVMGSSSNNSVVDKDQKVWEYQNLYAVGAGSMPSSGTANPTLTIAALSIRTAQKIIENNGILRS